MFGFNANKADIGHQRYVPETYPNLPHTVEGLLARSPDVIRERRAWLQDRCALAISKREGHFTATEQTRGDLENAKTDLARLQRDALDPANKVSQAALDAARDKLGRAKKLHAATTESHRTSSALVNGLKSLADSIDRFLAGRKTEEGLTVVSVKLAAPKTGSWGDLHRSQGEKVVAPMKREREQARVLPDTAENVERKLLRELDTLAEGGALGVVGLDAGSARGPRIAWPMTTLAAAPAGGGPGDRPRVVDLAALLARHLKPALEAEVKAAVADAYLGVEESLGPNERRTRLRDLDRQIAEAERAEGEAFWRAVGDGEDVLPRFDMAPAAFLGVAA